MSETNQSQNNAFNDDSSGLNAYHEKISYCKQPSRKNTGNYRHFKQRSSGITSQKRKNEQRRKIKMDNQSAVEIAKNETAEIEKQKAEANPAELAERKLRDILERILDGDMSPTMADVKEAESDLRFAKLRQTAQVEREQKRVKTKKRKQLKVLNRRLSAIQKVESFEKSLLKTEKSLDKYLSKMKSRNEKISEIHQELIGGSFTPIPNYINFDVAGNANCPVRIGDAEAQGLDPREKVERLVAEILQRHFPRQAG